MVPAVVLSGVGNVVVLLPSAEVDADVADWVLGALEGAFVGPAVVPEAGWLGSAVAALELEPAVDGLAELGVTGALEGAPVPVG